MSRTGTAADRSVSAMGPSRYWLWLSRRSSGVRTAGVTVAPSSRSWRRAAARSTAAAASRPRSATISVRMPVLVLAHAPTSSPSQLRAHGGLDHRDVLPGEHEQRPAHGHPPDQRALPVQRVGHVRYRGRLAAGQHREVNRGRVGRVQRGQRRDHLARARRTARKTVPPYQRCATLPGRDPPRAHRLSATVLLKATEPRSQRHRPRGQVLGRRRPGSRPPRCAGCSRGVWRSGSRRGRLVLRRRPWPRRIRGGRGGR